MAMTDLTGNPAEPVQGHWCLGVSVGVLPLYLVGRRRIHGHAGSFQHPLDLSHSAAPRALPSFPTRSSVFRTLFPALSIGFGSTPWVEPNRFTKKWSGK